MIQAGLAGGWRFGRKADTESDETVAASRQAASDDDKRDKERLQAGRAGDQAALEQLLGRYEPDLLRLCYSLLLNRSDAEDAVQETFLRFLRTLSTYRGEASVKTWLFRIAINLCRDWGRHHKSQARDRIVPLDGALADTLLNVVVPHQSSLEALIISRLTIEAALATLSPRQRMLLVLREQEQWSSKEIGQMLGWSERKVQYELVKVRQLLADWKQQEETHEKAG